MKYTAKYKTKLCENTMTFQECELAILRNAVDESDKIIGEKIANSSEVTHMISIVESFIISKKLICYGGTAVNNILPKFAQFYNKNIEVPDYDFYSTHAYQDAIELADIYYKAGYVDVEAKSGIHFGTYKVFVNFIPMADITLLPTQLFKSLSIDAITIAGIRYAPANFLRMNMFLELSRPAGDLSRWEKVLKRLTLLNTYYPFLKNVDINCSVVDFQRRMETHVTESELIYLTIRDTFVDLGVIFFGGYASSLYATYMPNKQRNLMTKIPDFDVLSEDPNKTAMIIKEQLNIIGIKNVKIIPHNEIGEIVPFHVEIKIGIDMIAFVYKPNACMSYNTISVDGKKINVATIDTMLTMYLAFYYIDSAYYERDRILCMAQFLFNLQQKNLLEQKGLLKRFSIQCYGKQSGMEDIRAEKALKFKELENNRDSEEYKKWFLKYIPGENRKQNKKHKLGKYKPKTLKNKKRKRTPDFLFNGG